MARVAGSILLLLSSCLIVALGHVTPALVSSTPHTLSTLPFCAVTMTSSFNASSFEKDLVSCLQTIPGARLFTPSSEEYASLRRGFNLHFDYYPAAVFSPTSTAEAAAAIRCAAAHHIPVAPRSGGHSYEGYSQGGQDGSLIIDLDQFQKIELDSTSGIVTVGAGVRLGTLYTHLWHVPTGPLLVPAGTCPTVGIAGLALGGGLGMVGRRYGLLSDNVVGMTMLDAHGHLLNVDADSYPDLFWALRGAGAGSFGLVTEFQIQTYSAADPMTTYAIQYPLAAYRAAIPAFEVWGATLPDDWMAVMNLDRERIRIHIHFLGPQLHGRATVERLIEDIGSDPMEIQVVEDTWLQAAVQWAGGTSNPLESTEWTGSRYVRGRSLLYRRSLSVAEQEIIYRGLIQSPRSTTVTRVIFDLWGGKLDRPTGRSPSSAFDHHRGVHSSLQFLVAWNDSATGPGSASAECLQWSARLVGEMRQEADEPLEAYQNYIERDLPNALQAYYGDGLPRLQQIKKTWDPQNVFSFPLSIPLPQEP